MGFTPPSDETFAEVAERFIAHQRARLTEAAFVRDEGIVRTHLIPAFPVKMAEIRRVNIQRYIAARTGKVSPDSIIKEFNTLNT